MQVIHARCAGLDISKRDAKVCVRVAGRGRRKTVETVTTWGSMTSQILALRDHLIAEQITCAVMEATSDYWKPFYHLLEDAVFDVLLVNARHMKNLSGRKTDVADAPWLAQLGAHGLSSPLGRAAPGGNGCRRVSLGSGGPTATATRRGSPRPAPAQPQATCPD